MAGDLRGFALEKAELISSRLKELLSSGEGYMRTHFGVDLGLKAELYPPWVILLTAAVGLLLAVSCAAVCSGLVGGKKRRTPVITQESTEPDKALLTKNNAKSEDLKKKNKKKLSEKNQSNGQPVSVSQEEVQLNEKLSPKIKTEKVHEVQASAQVKKNKKKKPDAKPTQQASASDGKEPDDGAWETKVSNREKRQQRKKERGPDDSGSPGGVDVPKTHVEGSGLRATKKNKGNHDSLASRSSGRSAATGAASSTWSEEVSSNSAGWTDMSLKMSGQMGPMEGPKWGTIPATQPWTQETQAWSGIDSRMKTDLNPVSFSMLGLSTTEPTANPLDLKWKNQQDAGDEWSGFNGMAAVDPTSDWNAPVEHWGNYEEPPEMVTPVCQIKEQPGINKLTEDEKDSEDPSEGAAKSKRKRRKKKKSEEEAVSVTQMMSSVPQGTVPKRQELLAQASHKSNIFSTQKKPEETAEPPNPTQKKKARRET